MKLGAFSSLGWKFGPSVLDFLSDLGYELEELDEFEKHEFVDTVIKGYAKMDFGENNNLVVQTPRGFVRLLHLSDKRGLTERLGWITLNVTPHFHGMDGGEHEKR